MDYTDKIFIISYRDPEKNIVSQAVGSSESAIEIFNKHAKDSPSIDVIRL